MKRRGHNEEETSLGWFLYGIQERSYVSPPPHPHPLLRAPHNLKGANNQTEDQETMRGWPLHIGLREKILGGWSDEWQLAQRKMGLRIKVIWNLILIALANLQIWMNRIVFNEVCLWTQTLQVKISVATKSISFISFMFIDKGKIVFSLSFSNAVAEYFLRKISVTDKMHLKF